MTTLEVLVAARKLIEKPENWLRNEVEVRRPDGSDAFCAVGAICKVARAQTPNITFAILDVLAGVMPGAEVHLLSANVLGKFNDTHSHAEVLALFDRAIESEQQRELTERLLAEEKAGDAEGLPRYVPQPITGWAERVQAKENAQ